MRAHPLLRLLLLLALLTLALAETASGLNSSPLVQIAEDGSVSVNDGVLTPETAHARLEALLKKKPKIDEHEGTSLEFTASGIIVPRWHPKGFALRLPLVGGKSLDGKSPLTFEGELLLPGIRLIPNKTNWSALKTSLAQAKFRFQQNDYNPSVIRINIGDATIVFTPNNNDTLNTIWIGFYHPPR